MQANLVSLKRKSRPVISSIYDFIEFRWENFKIIYLKILSKQSVQFGRKCNNIEIKKAYQIFRMKKNLLLNRKVIAANLLGDGL